MRVAYRFVFFLPSAVLLLAATAGPAAADDRPAKEVKPHFYKRVVVLAVGINQFHSKGIGPLTQAEADATAFADFVEKQYGYKADRLLGKKATREAIEEKLAALEKDLGPEDALVIYFASHGHAFDLDVKKFGVKRVGYLIPTDADLNLNDVSDPARWEQEALNMQTLVDRLEKMKAHHVLLIADTCCSGFLTKRGGLEAPEARALLVNKSRTVLAATTQREKAKEGVFTPALLALLKQYADDRDVVCVTDVFQQLLHTVPDKSKGTMTPQLAQVGEGDGELLFIPLAVPEESVKPVEDAVRAGKEDIARLELVRGVFDRARKRAGRKTTLAAVVEAAEAPGYWFGGDAADEAQRWERVRDRFAENAAWGDPLAMAGLHFCYARGLGEKEPKVNAAEAYRWARAADAVAKPAGVGRYLLGRCYQYGLGVTENPTTAAKLYEESAQLGFLLGRVAVAEVRLRGEPTAADAATAKKWLEEAAEAKVPAAHLLLADAYSSGRLGLTKDTSAALKHYNAAADLESARAQFFLYQVYSGAQAGVADKDLKVADKNLRAAAGSGFQEAQLTLAAEYYQKEWFVARLRLKQDYVEARRWAEPAAKQGSREAHKLLALLHARGDGTPFSSEKAKFHYDESTDHGKALDVQWSIKLTRILSDEVIKRMK